MKNNYQPKKYTMSINKKNIKKRWNKLKYHWTKNKKNFDNRSDNKKRDTIPRKLDLTIRYIKNIKISLLFCFRLKKETCLRIRYISQFIVRAMLRLLESMKNFRIIPKMKMETKMIIRHNHDEEYLMEKKFILYFSKNNPFKYKSSFFILIFEWI